MPGDARSPSKPSPAATPLAVILAACAIAAPLTLKSEGTVKHGYLDPVGVVTDCTGHTGAGAVLGRAYTDAECKAQLDADELAHGQSISPCITANIPVKTRAAFTDFAFNVGGGAFCKSSMARLANAGDLAGACKALELYVYAGKNPDGTPRKFAGLVTRRAAERKLCEDGLAGR